ncbi:hypothetical protein BDN70DRAFT_995694 [Pholiota conissans]|uniref:Uncharacterized protein n=1 Tax=Pholiota conissans TaxID=109636 RepID=A0A9P5YYN7_9AGAR|nr:hypothetical protein BDN70DRAFT_995694 [Pholiota conissans]
MDKLVFQLKSLTWIQIGDGDCAMFAHWLDTQKSLKELKWTCRNPVAVSPSACPNLTILEGNLHIITALIPNRPIEQLYGLDLLSLETHSNAAEYRRTLIKGCSSLTTLEFIGDCPQFIYYIPLPPNLRVLILSIRKGYGACTIFPLARCSALVKRLFSESLHLTRVDVAAQLISNEVSYERWERGFRILALVPSQDVFQERKILGNK